MKKAISLALLTLAGNAIAQASPHYPVTLAHTEQQTVYDKQGDAHQLYFSSPIAKLSTHSPIIITLDGNSLFAVGLRELNLVYSPQKTTQTNNKPILIGVGYPDTTLFNPRRQNDYTPINSHTLNSLINNQLIDKFGSRSYTLVGHSLGGLFVLERLKACLNNPCPYQHLVIASPSLWWQDEQILKEWQTLANSGKNFAHTPLPKVTLTVGALEQTPTQGDHARNKQLATRKMVDNTTTLSQLLTQLGIAHTFLINDNATHQHNAVVTLTTIINQE